MAEGDTDGVDFFTMGMFIIDEIEFPPPKPAAKDILGGAGTYSAVGARMFSPPPQSQSVGWVVDCGSDFPSELRETIVQWDTACLMRETPHRLTTRGWNGYGENDFRAFRYTTPKLRLDHTCLEGKLLWSKSFHLICSPIRCVDLVKNILIMRGQWPEPGKKPRPLFIWEPVPDLCTREELENCKVALKHVDVVSPNHSELGAFHAKTVDREGHVDYGAIEDLAKQWIQWGIGPDGDGAVVVRSGKDGCYIRDQGVSKWIPAVHESAEKVVDPTGGGNGFLGGFAVGFVRCGNVEDAAVWGSIAASFAIEQIGMPTLIRTSDGETWNGERVEQRLADFRKRLDKYVQP
ncbi:Ribokinase-like protein [Mytilinidion resinicola]|uniref:Ribokinase-like protein n=1 Tax=Mytilinidion resinicola TaxID=574789 RepID=A0A6A6Z7L7_9PEZI|nr:Ribokinase-like protein [Mytilinidion resinicola]KAF2817102.1 Ribokinase-like protein [Mytilinidion resinicola]